LSLSSVDFRLACGHFATGVAILTTASPEGIPHGLTVNSFVSLSLDPPLVMAAIGHSSSMLGVFDIHENFAVNILSEGQRELSTLFAANVDNRFQGVSWETGVTGSPLLAGTIAAIECRLIQRFDEGDHRVIIGEAIETHITGGKPLVFFRSGYRTLDG
jgi:flavin reductase (DIM6/NTAB) family NADH-FMN oxidoreductase RutF